MQYHSSIKSKLDQFKADLEERIISSLGPNAKIDGGTAEKVKAVIEEFYENEFQRLYQLGDILGAGISLGLKQHLFGHDPIDGTEVKEFLQWCNDCGFSRSVSYAEYSFDHSKCPTCKSLLDKAPVYQ